jgi:hypothetical protein
MVRRGDDDSIEARVSEEIFVIGVGLGAGGVLEGAVQVGRVDVRDGDAFLPKGLKLLVEVAAPATGGDDAISDAVISAESGLGNEERRGGSGEDGLKKIAALHDAYK